MKNMFPPQGFEPWPPGEKSAILTPTPQRHLMEKRV